MEAIYPSKYTDKKVNIAQWLAEKMCERQACTKGQELPLQFWSNPKYKREFLHQVQLAHALLKLYNQEAIVNVLKVNTKIYSLNAPFLDGLVKAEETKLSKQAQVKNEEPTIENEAPINLPVNRQSSQTKSPLSKLRNYDSRKRN